MRQHASNPKGWSTMNTASKHKAWTVAVEIEEMGDETEARASLEIEGATIGGWGRARRSPSDPNVPRIGDELATARALGDLAHRILEVTALEVEQFSSGEVHLHS